VEVTAGTSYAIRVDSRFGSLRDLTLRIREAEPNDMQADAAPLDLPASETIDTASYTTEPGEPSNCFLSRTAWYRMTGVTGAVRISLESSMQGRGVVSVYRSTPTDELEAVVCRQVPWPGTRTELTLEALASETYYLRVGRDSSGSLPVLGLDVEVVPPPANDTSAGAEVLPWAQPVDGDTAGATGAGEPAPSCVSSWGATVWYSVTPAEDGPMLISTAGADFDTVLAVYEGSADASSEIGCNDDHDGLRSRVRVEAQAGHTYLIQAGGYGDARGALRISAGAEPLNDDRADATAVDGLVFSDEVVTTFASTERREPPNACIGAVPLHTVWYRIEDALPGVLVIDATGSDFDTAVAVYQGDDPDHFTETACADGPGTDTVIHAGLRPPGQSLSLSVQQGGTYWIQVGGDPGNTTYDSLPESGTLRLRITGHEPVG
jgi:hypothetical protein